MRILIEGHSIIFWACERAATSPFGSQLGFGVWAQVDWVAKRGMLCGQILPLFLEYLQARSPPLVLVFTRGKRLVSEDIGVLEATSPQGFRNN